MSDSIKRDTKEGVVVVRSVQMDATLGATTIFMDGKVYAIEKNDIMKNGVKRFNEEF